MASSYASHRLRSSVGLTLAIAGMAFAIAGAVALVAILYLANFTPILPLSDASMAVPTTCMLEGSALLLGVIALTFLRDAPRQFKVIAWIDVGIVLIIALIIGVLLFLSFALADG